MLVDEQISKTPVDALHQAVPSRLFWRHRAPVDTGLVSPRHDGGRSELGAIVANDRDRVAPLSDENVQLAGDTLA